MAKALAKSDMCTALSKHYNKKCPEAVIELTKQYSDRIFITVGMERGLDILQRYEDKYERSPNICIDVANGYTEKFKDRVEEVRINFPESIIMAGNVCTPEQTQQLIFRGADIVKIGIGPGSVCTTRRVTGVGYPQLSAIDECANAAHGLNGHICGDGGCQHPGDIVKAFAAGADFVMIGGMLAGHEECGTTEFRGMASKEAQGQLAKYRAAEGKQFLFEHTRGPVSSTIQQILGGLRSGCTYIGARSLKNLPKCATFVRVNRQLNDMFGG
jgi:GMP reductase